jgi:hypothetical protein
MPVNRLKLYEKISVQTVPYINDNRAKLGMAASTELGKWYDEVFTPLYNEFMNSYNAWEDPAMRTRLIVFSVMKAEERLKKEYRRLFNLLKGNISVNNTDLIAMGLPERRTGGRTPSRVMETAPGLRIICRDGNRVQLEYYDVESPYSRAKPKGQHGAEVRWCFSDTPVNDTEALIHTVVGTASPIVLEFNGTNRGRTFYLAIRWENKRGLKGPWSNIIQAVVP